MKVLKGCFKGWKGGFKGLKGLNDLKGTLKEGLEGDLKGRRTLRGPLRAKKGFEGGLEGPGAELRRSRPSVIYQAAEEGQRSGGVCSGCRSITPRSLHSLHGISRLSLLAALSPAFRRSNTAEILLSRSSRSLFTR